MRGAIITTLAAAFLTTGCAEDIVLDFRIQSSPPIQSTVRMEENTIELEEGLAVVVVAVPFEEDDDRLGHETELEIQVINRQFLDVTRLEYPEDEEDLRDEDIRNGDWFFTFAAQGEGRTAIEYYVDGDFEGEIPVTITPSRNDSL